MNQIELQLSDDEARALDAWIAAQDDSPSRAEALRRLLAIALRDRRPKPR